MDNIPKENPLKDLMDKLCACELIGEYDAPEQKLPVEILGTTFTETFVWKKSDLFLTDKYNVTAIGLNPLFDKTTYFREDFPVFELDEKPQNYKKIVMQSGVNKYPVRWFPHELENATFYVPEDKKKGPLMIEIRKKAWYLDEPDSPIEHHTFWWMVAPINHDHSPEKKE